MSNNIKFVTDEGNYPTRAYNFTLASDLYLFFKFESPESNCEIGVAFDAIEDGGDWYVNDGTLGGQDYEIIDDLIWTRLPRSGEWRNFVATVFDAVSAFNGI